MKTVFLLFFALTLVSCSSTDKSGKPADSTGANNTAGKAAEENKVLKKSTAGVFVIGQNISEAKTNYKLTRVQEVEQTEEGEQTVLMYNADDQGTTLVKIEIQPNEQGADIISEITVLSSEYQTDKKVGVNSSLEEFQKAYPDTKIFYTYVSNMYWMQTGAIPGMEFLLNAEDFQAKGKNLTSSDATALEAGDFKPGAKIKSVRIWE